jgi:hypothetical protein
MDNKVHHIPASQGCINSNGGAGIDHSNYSARDNDTLGNLVYNIGPFSLQDGLPAASYCATVQGIYHANLGGHIHNNIVYGTSGYGIQLWHAANQVQCHTIWPSIMRKTDKRQLCGRRHFGGCGDSPGNVLNDMTLSNNMVIYNRGVGIREYGMTGPDNRFLIIFYSLMAGTPLTFEQAKPAGQSLLTRSWQTSSWAEAETII